MAREAVLQITGDTILAGRGRLKPRLKGLRPPSPPARTSQNQTLPGATPGWGASLQPATAGFVAERSEALQARF